MRAAAFRRAALLALALLALGWCLLLAGIRLSRDGVDIARVETSGGGGMLYLPASAEPAEFRLTDAEDDGHSHPDLRTASGGMPAVLIFHSAGDGAKALATELARRGTAALVADADADPSLCWEWFSAQSFAMGSAMGLAAGPARAGEILDLAEKLSGNGREPAAVMALGDAVLLSRAAKTPGRNMLFLLRGTASWEERVAFCGSKSAAEHGFSGFFGMGTARGLRPAGRLENFAGKNVLTAVIDWQGSSLGHRIELSDDDLAAGSVRLCRCGAAAALAMALAVLGEGLIRGKRES